MDKAWPVTCILLLFVVGGTVLYASHRRARQPSLCAPNTLHAMCTLGLLSPSPDLLLAAEHPACVVAAHRPSVSHQVDRRAVRASGLHCTAMHSSLHGGTADMLVRPTGPMPAGWDTLLVRAVNDELRSCRLSNTVFEFS